MNARRKPMLYVLAAAAALLPACGGDDDAGSPTTTQATSSSVGQTSTTSPPTTAPAEVCTGEQPGADLALALNTEPRGLDPKTAASSGRTGAIELATLYDVLVSYDTTTGEYVPELAASLEPGASLDTWTLRLRDDVTFGNGDPMTADDVRASIERHKETGGRFQSLAAEITGMEVVDEHTLSFTLASPWGEFPFVLSGPVGMIVNPRVLAERGEEGLQRDASGAGAGAFELVEYANGERLVVEAKDDWWGGPVCLEEIEFTWLNDARLNYDALTVGEIDVGLFADPTVAAEARADGVANVGFLYGLGRTIVINVGLEGGTTPLADVRVRQALAHAIDPALIDERVTGGTGKPTSGIFHPDMGSHPGVDGPAYDPDEARSLLDAAKADLGWDGGVGLLAISNPASQEAALAVEALLETVGFDVELELVDTSTLVQRLTIDANFELVFSQSSVSDSAPWVRLEQFRSTSSRNRGSFADQAMDDALAGLRVAVTAEERIAALAEVQEVWNDTVPVVNTSATEDVVVWDDDVHGLRFSVESLVLLDGVYVGS